MTYERSGYVLHLRLISAFSQHAFISLEYASARIYIEEIDMSLPTVSEWLDLLGQFYEHYGYLVVFLGTLGENTAFLGFFLPGNSLALLGALYARLGTLHLGWVVFFATLGTVLGYHV